MVRTVSRPVACVCIVRTTPPSPLTLTGSIRIAPPATSDAHGDVRGRQVNAQITSGILNLRTSLIFFFEDNYCVRMSAVPIQSLNSILALVRDQKGIRKKFTFLHLRVMF